MRVTVTAKGPTLDALTRDTIRSLRAANRKAGRQLATAGTAAMRNGAPSMFGRRLGVAATVDAWPDRCAVEFHPARGAAGGWAIAESGRRGGYLVAPRHRAALAFAGRFAMFAHPGAIGGRQAWTRAGARLTAAVDATVDDVYTDALEP